MIYRDLIWPMCAHVCCNRRRNMKNMHYVAKIKLLIPVQRKKERVKLRNEQPKRRPGKSPGKDHHAPAPAIHRLKHALLWAYAMALILCRTRQIPYSIQSPNTSSLRICSLNVSSPAAATVLRSVFSPANVLRTGLLQQCWGHSCRIVAHVACLPSAHSPSGGWCLGWPLQVQSPFGSSVVSRSTTRLSPPRLFGANHTTTRQSPLGVSGGQSKYDQAVLSPPELSGRHSTYNQVAALTDLRRPLEIRSGCHPLSGPRWPVKARLGCRVALRALRWSIGVRPGHDPYRGLRWPIEVQPGCHPWSTMRWPVGVR